ncbi:unnamed protein product [Linum tenue]|uniref:Uncharacterized protein n=1 Tax=Linum tenue TaxID=586396 RepID=A0AAV0IWS5_9ROSI|nr:unnamed protein product [Linum tenue]
MSRGFLGQLGSMHDHKSRDKRSNTWTSNGLGEGIQESAAPSRLYDSFPIPQFE